MKKKKRIVTSFRLAFPYTLPILAGFLFLGMAYGIYMSASGFPAIYPILMSATIFAGSMEFVAAHFLLGAFDPFRAFAITLMVNARHLFYGISMLEKYKETGRKKYFLIFGMCDESFSINCSTDIPANADKGWFMFFVTLLNYFYWVLGATTGAILGNIIKFNTKGLDFVMTALFIVIFMEQWMKEKTHHSAILGLGITFLCFILFGAKYFIVPSMILILGSLTLFRRFLESKGVKAQ